MLMAVWVTGIGPSPSKTLLTQTKRFAPRYSCRPEPLSRALLIGTAAWSGRRGLLGVSPPRGRRALGNAALLSWPQQQDGIAFWSDRIRWPASGPASKSVSA